MSAIAGHVRVYVDGSCPKPGGPGGWGWVLVNGFDGIMAQGSGGCIETTNNQMELTSAIEGVRALTLHHGDVEVEQDIAPERGPVFIVSDSQYVTKGITEYMAAWLARDWYKVKNPVLWKVLKQMTDNAPFELGWRWVKGHSGNRFNEHSDLLAGNATAAYRIPEAQCV